MNTNHIRRLDRVAATVDTGEEDPKLHKRLDRELRLAIQECVKMGTDWRQAIRKAGPADAAEAFIAEMEAIGVGA